MPHLCIPHHRALGIHPGAFVQATAPSTVDVQDHTLWVDTSTPEPWQLKSWDQAAGVWRLIGAVNPAGLPAGAMGDILYYDGLQWVTLPIGALNESLTVARGGGALLPRWGAGGADSCCGTTIPITPITDTGSNIVNLKSRCGAATAMADYLELYYSRVRSLVVYGIGLVAGAGLAAIIDALVTAATGGLDAPWIAVVQPWVIKAAQLIGGWIITSTLSSSLPTLDSSDNATILEGIYTSLPTDGGPISVTADTLTAWQHFIEGATMPAGAHAQQLLDFLIGTVSLGSWQQLAYFGAHDPKDSCAGWSLLGTSFQGGATLGVTIEQSFQGGATLGVALEQSFQGGAALA